MTHFLEYADSSLNILLTRGVYSRTLYSPPTCDGASGLYLSRGRYFVFPLSFYWFWAVFRLRFKLCVQFCFLWFRLKYPVYSKTCRYLYLLHLRMNSCFHGLVGFWTFWADFWCFCGWPHDYYPDYKLLTFLLTKTDRPMTHYILLFPWQFIPGFTVCLSPPPFIVPPESTTNVITAKFVVTWTFILIPNPFFSLSSFSLFNSLFSILAVKRSIFYCHLSAYEVC